MELDGSHAAFRGSKLAVASSEGVVTYALANDVWREEGRVGADTLRARGVRGAGDGGPGGDHGRVLADLAVAQAPALMSDEGRFPCRYASLA